ncbi:Thermostable beta-glucosidase B [Symbiodinium microadriaticum]|uniref:beta-glucosidase n=1 Tax=Symbiodinium microadriaticum TaxID=2951 RepID=A0A1Q9DV24_SYMMI|nr:Thermostable beta-glucosidase B [Symbiodinium microadriaticum]
MHDSADKVLMPWREEVAAIACQFMGGVATGAAWASVLFGDAAPRGRLPVMMPETSADVIPVGEDEEVVYSEGLLTSYRSPTFRAAFPFGHGLAFTSFEYSGPHRLHKDCGVAVCVAVLVKNVGQRSGEELVQAYVHFPDPVGGDEAWIQATPDIMLKAFRRTKVLHPGESQTVRFDFSASDMKLFCSERGWVAQQKIEVRFGASSKDIRQTLATELAEYSSSSAFAPTTSSSPAIASNVCEQCEPHASMSAENSPEHRGEIARRPLRPLHSLCIADVGIAAIPNVARTVVAERLCEDAMNPFLVRYRVEGLCKLNVLLSFATYVAAGDVSSPPLEGKELRFALSPWLNYTRRDWAMQHMAVPRVWEVNNPLYSEQLIDFVAQSQIVRSGGEETTRDPTAQELPRPVLRGRNDEVDIKKLASEEQEKSDAVVGGQLMFAPAPQGLSLPAGALIVIEIPLYGLDDALAPVRDEVHPCFEARFKEKIILEQLQLIHLAKGRRAAKVSNAKSLFDCLLTQHLQELPPQRCDAMAPAASSALTQAPGFGRRVLVAATACGIAAFAVRGAATRLQNALLYHPRAIPGDSYYEKAIAEMSLRLQLYGYKIKELDYVVQKRQQKALFVRPEEMTDCPLWLVFGGNAMVSADWLPFCEAAVSMKEDTSAMPCFLLIDYPGFGFNSGEPSPPAALESSKQALAQLLRELGRKSPESINLLGHSLGAAAASQLAASLSRSDECARAQPGRLLLSSPFLSVDEMAAVLFGGLLPRWLLRALVTHRWNNAATVPDAAAAGWQVSIVHPPDDEIVPFQHGEELQNSVRALGKECELLRPKAPMAFQLCRGLTGTVIAGPDHQGFYHMKMMIEEGELDTVVVSAENITLRLRRSALPELARSTGSELPEAPLELEGVSFLASMASRSRPESLEQAEPNARPKVQFCPTVSVEPISARSSRVVSLSAAAAECLLASGDVSQHALTEDGQITDLAEVGESATFLESALDRCDDLRQQLQRDMEAWNTIARQRLSASRDARKRSEKDVQLLANRLRLLRSEEAKALRIIEEVRRRTREVLETRMNNEKMLQYQETAKQCSLKELEQKRRENSGRRARARSARQKAEQETTWFKKRQADEVRTPRLSTRSPSLESSPSLSSIGRFETVAPRVPQVADARSTARGAALLTEERELLVRLRRSEESARIRRPPLPPVALEDEGPVRSALKEASFTPRRKVPNAKQCRTARTAQVFVTDDCSGRDQKFEDLDNELSKYREGSGVAPRLASTQALGPPLQQKS